MRASNLSVITCLLGFALVAASACERQPTRAKAEPIAPTADGQTVSSDDGWKTLAAPDTQTVLHYPPGWRVQDEGFGIVAAEELRDGANCQVMVSKAPVQADHERRLVWLEENLATDHFTQIIERLQPTLSGLPGRGLVADYDQVRPEGTAETRMIQVHAPRSGRLFQLTCTSHRSTFDRRRPVFEEIVRRWQVPDAS